MPRFIAATCLIALLAIGSAAHAEDLRLEDLIAAAIKGNYELMASRSGIEAAQYRIPQAQSPARSNVLGRLPKRRAETLHLRRDAGLSVDVLGLADPALLGASAT